MIKYLKNTINGWSILKNDSYNNNQFSGIKNDLLNGLMRNKDAKTCNNLETLNDDII